jgi:hypothetical protein
VLVDGPYSDLDQRSTNYGPPARNGSHNFYSGPRRYTDNHKLVLNTAQRKFRAYKKEIKQTYIIIYNFDRKSNFGFLVGLNINRSSTVFISNTDKGLNKIFMLGQRCARVCGCVNSVRISEIFSSP